MLTLPLLTLMMWMLTLGTEHVLGVQYLTDYKDCGRRIVPEYPIENECFWECDWIPNPYYEDVFTVTVEDLGQCVDKTVTYYMMTRMIPRDLACMSECQHLPDNNNDEFEFNNINCGDADVVRYENQVYIGNTPEKAEEEYHKCYLNFRKRFATGEKTNSIPKDDKFFHYARTHRDLIFDICYVAKMFKDSNNIMYNNKICSDLVTCEKVLRNTQLTGTLLDEISSASAEGCEDLCKGRRNRCAAWTWNNNSPNNCNLFSVVTAEPQKRNGFSAGFCQALYDIKTTKKALCSNSCGTKVDFTCGRIVCDGKFCQSIPTSNSRFNKKRKRKQRWQREKIRKNTRRNRKGRLFGTSTQQINEVNKYPWVCSLRTFGFRGQHRCAANLLSAHPKTVLVSSAHCNFICKDKASKVVEICCCRKNINPTSCGETSSFCGIEPKLTMADPGDLQIVCGEHNIGEIPEVISKEKVVVLDVLKITNHPKYNQTKGPIYGYDIAVYHVNDTKLKDHINPRLIYPACLPRPDPADYLDTQALLPAWRDPKPKYFSESDQEESAYEYRLKNLLLRQVQLEEDVCKDPVWMDSNTYYPPNVRCFKDRTESSCLLFGSSGSGVVRPFRTSPVSPDLLSKESFAWVGTLSLNKGCDRAMIINSKKVSFGAENPSIFTDGSCYLDWIAKAYGLQLDPKLEPKKNLCFKGSGDMTDIDRTGHRCRTNLWKTDKKSYCIFDHEQNYNFQVTSTDTVNVKFDRCKLFGVEGYSENLNLCMDNWGRLAHCANNCLGVDPNAVVIGGTAVFAAAGFGGLGLLQSVVGLGAVGAVGAGGLVAMGVCPPPYCTTVRNGCQRPIISNGRLRCPRG